MPLVQMTCTYGVQRACTVEMVCAEGMEQRAWHRGLVREGMSRGQWHVQRACGGHIQRALYRSHVQSACKFVPVRMLARIYEFGKYVCRLHQICMYSMCACMNAVMYVQQTYMHVWIAGVHVGMQVNIVGVRVQMHVCLYRVCACINVILSFTFNMHQTRPLYIH